MTEALSFEAKVRGLFDYYRALEDLDPENPLHGDVVNPDFFYASGFNASRGLAKSKKSVLFDMGCHARVEYRNRGFAAKDLREDTDELRAERADVLAVMTAPLKAVVRQERAERIAGLLSNIASGETICLTGYDSLHHRHDTTREVAADVGRALFGVFRNGHISSRTLTVQYDTPVSFAPIDTKAGEPLMKIEVSDLFGSGGFSDALMLPAKPST